MSAERVAVRYAKAFVSLLQERDALADARSFLDYCDLVKDSAELTRLYHNASVSAADKVAVIKALSARLGHSEWVSKFLVTLGEARRLDALQAVAHAVSAHLDIIDNIRNVDLTTSVVLSEVELAEFSNSLKDKLGSDVRVATHIDASLLGGAVARVGSVVYDGSVRAQLNRLRAELVKEN